MKSRGMRRCHFRLCEVKTVSIRRNFVTFSRVKLIGGFEAVRVIRYLKKLSKTFPRILNKGEFLKGSGGQDMQMFVPMLDDEQAGQNQRRIL